jgi:hypothetical protein
MNGIGQRAGARLTEEQVDMFGHDDIAVYAQTKVQTGLLKSLQQKSAYRGAVHPRLPAVATEGYEMSLP